MTITDLKPYPCYKPSGVEWLGEVPAHWDVERLKRCMANIIEQTNARSDNELYVGLEHVESWTGRLTEVDEDIEFDSQVKSFEAGDILFGKLRPYLAKVTRPTRNGVCVGEFLVLRPRDKKIVGACIERSLRAKPMIDAVDSSTFGAKMPRADWQFVGAMPIAVPPVTEQIAIVRFLDHAERRIQRYIHAKEKLIALLEEQKRAVIHEAVTGRIDVRTGRPYPAYKPCGVEGLGDAPEHWDIARLSRLIRSGPKNGISPPADEHGALTSFAISAVRNGSVDVRDSDRKTVSRDGVAVGAYNLLADDILLVRGNGNLRLVGRAGLVERDMPGWIYPDLLMRLRLTDRAVPRFVVALLNLPAARSQVESSARTAVGTFKINSQHVRQLLFALPDIPEQLRILAHVSEQIQPLVERENQATRSVDLMREYRTRLIADVVTGKLDVREAAATLPEINPLADDDAANVPLDAAAESAFDDERKPVEAAD